MLWRNVLRDVRQTWRQKKRIKSIDGVEVRRATYIHNPSVEVEVYIPALEKDAEILPLVVGSVRKHIKHRIVSISVVCPDSDIMRQLCGTIGVRMLDERKVAPMLKEAIRYIHEGKSRSGWMYQQILKIACVLSSNTEHVFICDADTVFIRDQGFVSVDGIVFDVPFENHQPYKNAYEKLTGFAAPSDFSVTSHHIMVEKARIEALARLMETRFGGKWWEALCSIIDESENSCHSDYDTMGYYTLREGRKLLRYSENGSFSRRYLWLLDLPGISFLYRTLSFHAYNGY